MIEKVMKSKGIFDSTNTYIIGRKEMLFGLITIRKVMYGKNTTPKISNNK